MKTNQTPSRLKTALLCLSMILAAPAGAEEVVPPAHYPSADDAVDALIAAAVSDEPNALEAVLGSTVASLRSGDPIADSNDRDAFAAAAAVAANIEDYGEDAAILTLGEDNWPFPIPLVRDDEGWYFDTEAGAEEVLDRRIGRNELTTIAVLHELVDAQHEYAREDRNGDGVKEFAAKLRSADGTRDGLYWPAAEGESESPMGRFVAEAVSEGYTPGSEDGPRPYHGYIYRMLGASGDEAPGGAREYSDAEGRWTGGFAALAYPAEYGNSGIMTFIVDQRGLLFEKDLGAETEEEAAAITAFDPDKSWYPVTD